MDGAIDDHPDQPQGSDQGSDQGLTCAICCREDVPVKTPCGHYLCIECIRKHVQMRCYLEKLFPPTCAECGEPFDDIFLNEEILGESLLKFVDAKRKEFAIPVDQRVYCANGECALAMDSSSATVDNLVCPKCGTVTCKKCRAKGHGPDEDCPGKDVDVDLMKLVNEEEWQVCSQCSTIVERSEGCNQMT
jgi:E3 ubiquitin-protein ligase RNF144